LVSFCFGEWPPGLGGVGPRLVDVYLWFYQRMIYKLLVALRRFVSAGITRTMLYINPLQTAPKRVSCHSDSVHPSPALSACPFLFPSWLMAATMTRVMVGRKEGGYSEVTVEGIN